MYETPFSLQKNVVQDKAQKEAGGLLQKPVVTQLGL